MFQRHPCSPQHTITVPTTPPENVCCPRHTSTTSLCPTTWYSCRWYSRHTCVTCCRCHPRHTLMLSTTHLVSTTHCVDPTTWSKLHDTLTRHVSWVHDMLAHDVSPRHGHPRHPFAHCSCYPRRVSRKMGMSWRHVVGKIKHVVGPSMSWGTSSVSLSFLIYRHNTIRITNNNNKSNINKVAATKVASTNVATRMKNKNQKEKEKQWTKNKN